MKKIKKFNEINKLNESVGIDFSKMELKEIAKCLENAIEDDSLSIMDEPSANYVLGKLQEVIDGKYDYIGLL